MPNVFKKAHAEAKKQKKANADQVEIKGLYKLASIGLVMQALRNKYDEVEENVKSTMLDKFIEFGKVLKKQPKNFYGHEKNAKASCQLKKRSTRSPLSPEEVSLLKKHGISVEKVILKKKTFVINPKYTKDQKLLSKVSKKLKEIKDLPDDFITLESPKSIKATTEESLDEVFANVTDTNTLRKLLHTVAITAMKTEMEESDLDKAIDEVVDML